MHRYVSANDELLQSCGVVGPNGEHLIFNAVNGIVETRDEELARQLDVNPSLQRAT